MGVSGGGKPVWYHYWRYEGNHMVLTISYPANKAEWYAKGTLEGGTYFEVPATFNHDGTCDTAATDAKVQQLIDTLSMKS